jgi:hypothetical protein
VQQTKADARSKIQHPSEQPGIDPAAKQPLGKRRAGAEQGGRGQRHADTTIGSQFFIIASSPVFLAHRRTQGG